MSLGLCQYFSLIQHHTELKTKYICGERVKAIRVENSSLKGEHLQFGLCSLKLQQEIENFFSISILKYSQIGT